jgi:hypothetical protein
MLVVVVAALVSSLFGSPPARAGVLATTTTLTNQSPPPVAVGQSVSLRATVEGTSVPPSGHLDFFDGSTLVGSVDLNGSTSAAILAWPAAGTHQYTAVYSGDTVYQGSTSSPVSVTVDRAISQVQLTGSSATPPDQEVRADVGVGAPSQAPPGSTYSPTGRLTLLLDGTLIRSVVMTSRSFVEFTFTSPVAGHHTLTASYEGDANFTPASGDAGFDVPHYPTEGTIGSSAGSTPLSCPPPSSPSCVPSSAAGEPVTFSVTLFPQVGYRPRPPANRWPTGSVTFFVDNSPAAEVPVSGAGPSRADWTTRGLSQGTHFVHAVYSGDDRFSPWSSGAVPHRVGPPNPGSPPGPTVTDSSVGTRSGYWMLGVDGAVYAFGDAQYYGDASTVLPRSTSAVHIEATPDSNGYWIVSNAGDVFTFGDARFLGARPGLGPGESVSSLSSTASGAGYWLFTSKGRAIPFGDAVSFGDMTGTALNGPVLDSVTTPSARGYYMVGSDGGIFSFGDAAFHGSMGASHLNAPVVGMAPNPSGSGYSLVASDGGVFAFDSPFKGSMGSTKLNRPVIGMVAYGDGYLMVASDGGIFDFSRKAFAGSLGDHPPPRPVAGVAPVGG